MRGTDAGAGFRSIAPGHWVIRTPRRCWVSFWVRIPSVGELAALIADRAAGDPFFAEEMVRELVQRDVLTGERGGYTCSADVAEVSVPATVQAAIAARIDRLSTRPGGR